MKHIVIIIDGTWVSAADRETPFSNAYNLNWLLDNRAKDGCEQIVLYSSGVGTDKSALPFFSGATARGIDHQTREAYINICSNFKRTDNKGRSDKIYIFGFSRGAIVARALSALVSDYGIIRPSHMNYFPTLWNRFVQGKIIPDGYLESVIHRPVPVEMLGLFDCVFGIASRSGQFHTLRFSDFKVAQGVKAAVHLLSLDDTRVAFEPMPLEPRDGVTVEQIWMPGVHSDIGGTYAANRLGRISLVTMIDRIQAHTGLRFERKAIEQIKSISGGVVVNDERVGAWKLSALRTKTRRYSANQNHYLHPIIPLLQQTEISYKGRWRLYSLHKSFLEGEVPCPYFTEFNQQHDWRGLVFGP
jgi:uncharacterized protein (DUF2235 family)